MVIVRGPDKELLNKSFKVWRKSKKKQNDESEQKQKSNRNGATVYFIINSEDGNRIKIYLQVTSWVRMGDKMVGFTAIDAKGRKVKGQYEPPASARERLLLSPDMKKGIGELKYIDG
jgi:hypothetical protein